MKTPITFFRCIVFLSLVSTLHAEDNRTNIDAYFSPPPEFANQFGAYASPLKFDDGHIAKDAAEWPKRRAEILTTWTALMGAWPPLLTSPRLEIVSTAHRDTFTQHRIKIEIAADFSVDGYLLVPDGKGPFSAVFVPFYDPETSVGLNPKSGAQRDFAYQLTSRNFVTLSIGSPGGDARKPKLDSATCQPLSFLAYVAANVHTALAQRPEVDPSRIGVMGHSYGGKWAMFAACLYEKFACGVWSDPGIAFDDTRNNINYWEPWYLGFDSKSTRKPGLITPGNPSTGAYKTIRETGHDLIELQALMPPRPFLVSGGAEDTPSRWIALNHIVSVNTLLGQANRVAMTNRKDHTPSPESNSQMIAFFERFLMDKK